MVISTTERTYMNGGKPFKVIVKLKDDAYRDCSPEEIEARRRDFAETAQRLANAARARKERAKEP